VCIYNSYWQATTPLQIDMLVSSSWTSWFVWH